MGPRNQARKSGNVHEDNVSSKARGDERKAPRSQGFGITLIVVCIVCKNDKGCQGLLEVLRGTYQETFHEIGKRPNEAVNRLHR